MLERMWSRKSEQHAVVLGHVWHSMRRSGPIEPIVHRWFDTSILFSHYVTILLIGTPYYWSSWGPWGACLGCGAGQQNQTRTCLGDCGSTCPGLNEQSQPCTIGVPFAWSPWSLWSACSGCGTGSQFQSRVCNGTCGVTCSGALSESQSCVGAVPYYWGSWGPWSACSSTCGVGTQMANRTCLGSCGAACTGQGAQTQMCSVGVPVTWSAWSASNTCSNMCGAGSIVQTRNCGNGTCGTCSGGGTVIADCFVGSPRSWTDWTVFGACNVSCGTGFMNQTRNCTAGDCGDCGGGASILFANCSAGNWSYFTDWSAWGPCSTSCGFNGVQSSNRACVMGTCGASCATGPFTRSQLCGGSGFTDWSAWSNCSVGCGYGSISRTRTALGCPGLTSPLTDDQPCVAGPNSTWSAWVPASECSSICGSGTQLVTRSCVGCVGTCHGSNMTSATCEAGDPKSWSGWSSFGACSVPCNAGIMLRNRKCLGCVGACNGSATDSQACLVVPCPIDCALQWGNWSACSASCGVGVQTRAQRIAQEAQFGGAACPAPMLATQPCFQQLCDDCSNPHNGPNALPCLNGGRCIDSAAYDGLFACACASGFAGANCQDVAGQCSVHCANFGSCQQHGGNTTCNCSQVPFAGPLCDVPLSPAAADAPIALVTTSTAIVFVPIWWPANVANATVEVCSLSNAPITQSFQAVAVTLVANGMLNDGSEYFANASDYVSSPFSQGCCVIDELCFSRCDMQGRRLG